MCITEKVQMESGPLHELAFVQNQVNPRDDLYQNPSPLAKIALQASGSLSINDFGLQMSFEELMDSGSISHLVQQVHDNHQPSSNIDRGGDNNTRSQSSPHQVSRAVHFEIGHENLKCLGRALLVYKMKVRQTLSETD